MRNGFFFCLLITFYTSAKSLITVPQQYCFFFVLSQELFISKISDIIIIRQSGYHLPTSWVELSFYCQCNLNLIAIHNVWFLIGCSNFSKDLKTNFLQDLVVVILFFVVDSTYDNIVSNLFGLIHYFCRDYVKKITEMWE